MVKDIMNIENKFLTKAEIVEKGRIEKEKKARMRSAAARYDDERETALEEKEKKPAEKAKKEAKKGNKK